MSPKSIWILPSSIFWIKIFVRMLPISSLIILLKLVKNCRRTIAIIFPSIGTIKNKSGMKNNPTLISVWEGVSFLLKLSKRCYAIIP